MKNEVATTKTNAVAEVSSNVHVDIAREDMMVPFLKVIQSLSEEVVPGKDKYNPDVRPGDIYDSITRTIFKDAKVVICGLRKYYTEWTPEVRGSIVAKHSSNADIVKNAAKVEMTAEKGNTYYALKTATGNDLIETYGVVMIAKTEDGLTLPAVLTLSKTGFMVGKQLTTLLAIHQTKGTPVFRLNTVSVSNSKGSWFKPAFAFDSYETDESVINMANAMAPITDSILFNNASSDDDAVKADEDDLL